MSFGDYLLPTLLLLGILIFFHELGHFAVAKYFNVKVERFSIGFGPAILRWTRGETEYRLAWIPLGGYVKMLGEGFDEDLTEAEKARSFNGQGVWPRIAIASAGPIMNFVLPVVVIAAVMIFPGWPNATSKIGTVASDSVAEKVGLHSGDRVVEVNGSAVNWFSEVRTHVSSGTQLSFIVERGNARKTVVIPGNRGEVAIGISSAIYPAYVQLLDDESPAGRAGVLSGDRVLSINGATVTDWPELERKLSDGSDTFVVEVERVAETGGSTETTSVAINADGHAGIEALGLGRSLALNMVLPNKPADIAGLEAGDIVVQTNGKPVSSHEDLVAQVNASEGEAIAFDVLRGTDRLQFSVKPDGKEVTTDGVTTKSWVVGVQVMAAAVAGETADEVIRNPIAALQRGLRETYQITGRILGGMGMLFSGQVGLDGLAGPIGIAKLAGDFFSQPGWVPYLWFMCIISVNLAILNLLPVPVLDGGHIVFALVEMVKGSPVTRRTVELATTIGLSLVLLLMGFAIFNDFSGLFKLFSGS